MFSCTEGWFCVCPVSVDGRMDGRAECRFVSLFRSPVFGFADSSDFSSISSYILCTNTYIYTRTPRRLLDGARNYNSSTSGRGELWVVEIGLIGLFGKQSDSDASGDQVKCRFINHGSIRPFTSTTCRDTPTF